MGDIVEEMDTHRRKSFALLARKGADGRCELDEGELPPVPRASRSFSKVPLLRDLANITLCCFPSHMAFASPMTRSLLPLLACVNSHVLFYQEKLL